MSFVDEFKRLPLGDWVRRVNEASIEDARASLARTELTLADFASLISPGAVPLIEEMARRAQALTRQRFGRVIRLFAPLYLSNECINICKYCGFSRDNPILRVTLDLDDAAREGAALAAQGFRNVLLVAGEHPKFISGSYLEDCTRLLHRTIPGISLEVAPMEIDEYQRLCGAGAEGLVVYQETYDREAYAELHTAGPKRDFDWRLETPERAYAAGFRRLGIGALYGLSDWRLEAMALAAHAAYLLRACWKAQLTISVPRLRPNAGEFKPRTQISDRELAQLICALRLFLPDVGLVLSTREPARLRDGLVPLGITMMSAGSHTEPGGYTGAGNEKLHRTRGGRLIPIERSVETEQAATRQFDISDSRSPDEVAQVIRRLGYEPVWKDWDAAMAG